MTSSEARRFLTLTFWPIWLACMGMLVWSVVTNDAFSAACLGFICGSSLPHGIERTLGL